MKMYHLKILTCCYKTIYRTVLADDFDAARHQGQNLVAKDAYWACVDADDARVIGMKVEEVDGEQD